MPPSKRPAQPRRNPHRSQLKATHCTQVESNAMVSSDDGIDSDIYRADLPDGDSDQSSSSQDRNRTPPSPIPTSQRKRKRHPTKKIPKAAATSKPSESCTTSELPPIDQTEGLPTVLNYHDVGHKPGRARMTVLLAQNTKHVNRLSPTHLLEALALQESYLLDKMALALASNVSLKTLEAAM